MQVEMMKSRPGVCDLALREVETGGPEKFEYMVIVFEGSDKKIGCQHDSKKILQ